MTSLIDPDCRDGKHRSCIGGPCECACHEQPPAHPSPLVDLPAMAGALPFIVERHRPDVFSAASQGLTCQTCTQTAGIPIAWPCPDREAIGRLLPDASNRLLPEPPASSLQPGCVPSVSSQDG